MEMPRFPKMLQGESLKRLLQGVAVGVIITVVVGFKYFSWTTAGSAEEMAKTQSTAAVVAALMPVCVARFGADANAKVNLVALQNASSWNRADLIDKGGWSMLPGQTTSASGVADACASFVINAPKV